MAVDRPILLTAGEPAGIGPELCVQIAAEGLQHDCVVIGDPDVLAQRAAVIGSPVAIRSVSAEDTGAPVDGELRVIPFRFPEKPVCGELNTENASTLLAGLRFAAEACLRGEFRALVTAPLQKSIINDAGIPFSGHTEFLAEVTGADKPVMLLVADELRVALATTHLPLRDVPDAITASLLRCVLSVLHADLKRRFRLDDPVIAVCGLNPHAGEGGHLGTEEQDVITPVLDELRESGMRLRGPMPADTLFTPAGGQKDAVLAMYHDQGLPVLKYAGFGNAVNVTLGLPIIRTSVDHGTALDIAGKGEADPGSLRTALDLAASLS
ncbi:MAG: 4-hydroxythreonine-4-phosphate dehydrogenase PdxA [Woeseiaceae bacterium]|nr:4-hydroxythreonine-4-phosphate dehydrogenase PdxA [Woeseiaceae bacterium]